MNKTTDDLIKDFLSKGGRIKKDPNQKSKKKEDKTSLISEYTSR